MTTIHFAATAPVNPTGTDAAVPLSEAQLWAGLQQKVRHAEAFVPVISSCDVLREEGNVVTRRVAFQGKPAVTETCTEFAPARIHFRMENGTEVQNIISQGPGGELFLTFAFAWPLADVTPGSEQALSAVAAQKKTAGTAIAKTLDTTRAMVADGRIKA